MVNDFAQLVKPDLSDYEADGVSLHNHSLIALLLNVPRLGPLLLMNL
jgi:hypothetical protein